MPADQPVELASFAADQNSTWRSPTTSRTPTRRRDGRIREDPDDRAVEVRRAPEPARDPGQQIVLAVVRRTGPEVTGVDTTGRRAAGAAGGSLDVLGLGFRDPSIVSTGWVRMRLEAVNTPCWMEPCISRVAGRRR